MRACLLVVVTACSFQGLEAGYDAAEGRRDALPAAPDALDAARDAPDAAQPPDAAVAFCDPGDATLVACYEFEATGSDGSQYHNNATGSSALAFAPGHRGSAFESADTTNFRVNASSSLNVTDAASVEMWVDPSAIADTFTVDDDDDYAIHVAASGVMNCSFAGVSPSPMGGKLTTGTWTHVACTYDGSNMSLYIDGQLVMATATSSGTRAPGNGNGLAIGHDSPSGPHFHGLIDSVRIYSVARSAAQIAAAADL